MYACTLSTVLKMSPNSARLICSASMKACIASARES